MSHPDFAKSGMTHIPAIQQRKYDSFFPAEGERSLGVCLNFKKET